MKPYRDQARRLAELERRAGLHDDPPAFAVRGEDGRLYGPDRRPYAGPAPMKVYECWAASPLAWDDDVA